jgi:hypothetical protein
MLKQLKLVVRTCVEEETRAGIAEFVPVSSHWRLESLLAIARPLGQGTVQSIGSLFCFNHDMNNVVGLAHGPLVDVQKERLDGRAERERRR